MALNVNIVTGWHQNTEMAFCKRTAHVYIHSRHTLEYDRRMYVKCDIRTTLWYSSLQMFKCIFFIYSTDTARRAFVFAHFCLPLLLVFHYVFGTHFYRGFFRFLVIVVVASSSCCCWKSTNANFVCSCRFFFSGSCKFVWVFVYSGHTSAH